MFVFLIFNFIFFKKLKQIKNNFFTKFKKPKQLNNNKIKNFNKIDMGTCNICCEKLNLSTRKEILCNYKDIYNISNNIPKKMRSIKN